MYEVDLRFFIYCNTFTVIDYVQCWKLKFNQYYHQIRNTGIPMYNAHNLLIALLYPA